MLDLDLRPLASLAGLALLAATAHAQPGVAVGNTCEPVTITGSCDTCATRESCIAFEAGPTCVPFGALCCVTDADCPYDAVHTLSCARPPGAREGLCLEAQDYCEDADAVSVDRVRACHRGSNGLWAPWADGDCDGDGMHNEAEIMAGTDPCLAPPALGVWLDGQCNKVPLCAEAGGDCVDGAGEKIGTCVRYDDGSAIACQVDDPIPCATVELVCPAGLVAAPYNETESLCVDPGWCPGWSSEALIACVLDDETRTPTIYAEGDCDGDTDENDGDEDPCGIEADAGGGPDGGAPGAPPPGLTFRGGGGCACRVGPRRDAPSLWLLALAAALGLSRAARRARRSR